MGRRLALQFCLLLGTLLLQGLGGLLEVHPPGAEVPVALGGSLQLTCRLLCAEPGAAASVRWRGLDTSLGAMEPGSNLSVLYVRNASLATAGTRVCTGSCGRESYQHSVKLLVFAFPNQLSVSPGALVPGQELEVACTAHNVTPAHPDHLSLSLLLGDRELEGLQALNREVEEEDKGDEVQEGEDPLFRVTQRWQLPPLDTLSPPATLHCQATMTLPGLERTHLLPIPVLKTPSSPEPSVTTTLDATSVQDSTHSASTQSPTPQTRTLKPCHPHIRQWQVPTGLELLCEADCGPGAFVRWTRAPGGLAAFEKQETGPQAWLSLPWTKCSAEGWFQCRVDPGGLNASLYVIPKICSPPVPAELWAGTMVLGLLLLVMVTYHLWRRCKHTH